MTEVDYIDHGQENGGFFVDGGEDKDQKIQPPAFACQQTQTQYKQDQRRYVINVIGIARTHEGYQEEDRR